MMMDADYLAKAVGSDTYDVYDKIYEELKHFAIDHQFDDLSYGIGVDDYNVIILTNANEFEKDVSKLYLPVYVEVNDKVYMFIDIRDFVKRKLLYGEDLKSMVRGRVSVYPYIMEGILVTLEHDVRVRGLLKTVVDFFVYMISDRIKVNLSLDNSGPLDAINDLRAIGEKMVLLTGPTGSGKTTLAYQYFHNLGKKVGVILGNGLVSTADFVGYRNLLNNETVTTLFRKAVVEGHGIIIEEIDAIPASILMILTTLSNGTMKFPDGVVNVHEEFFLLATSNVINREDIGGYTGRQKVDKATINKFSILQIEYENIKNPLMNVLNNIIDEDLEYDAVISAREVNKLIKYFQLKAGDGDLSEEDKIAILANGFKLVVASRYPKEDIDYLKVAKKLAAVDFNELKVYEGDMPELLTL
jgi:MoxR-like ATPase